MYRHARQVLDGRGDLGIRIEPGLEMMAKLVLPKAFRLLFQIVTQKDIPPNAYLQEFSDQGREEVHRRWQGARPPAFMDRPGEISRTR